MGCAVVVTTRADWFSGMMGQIINYWPAHEGGGLLGTCSVCWLLPSELIMGTCPEVIRPARLRNLKSVLVFLE